MTGIFIVARLGSTRLKQKHLIEVGGKTFIEWLVARYTFEFNKQIENEEVSIFIVTSINKENKKFEIIFEGNSSIKIFYGADSNIPLRQLQCADAHNIDEIISIDGDDILCSTQAAVLVRNRLMENCDFVKTSGLPLGMNVMGYKRNFLKIALQNTQCAILETGWGRIFDEEKAENIFLGDYDQNNRLRMTLDYNEDAEFFKVVIEGLKEQILKAEDTSLIDYIIKNKFYQLNEKVNDIYWDNFDKQKKSETRL